MGSLRCTLLLSLATALLASCASRVYFRPREGATAESPDGRPAAQYTLAAEDGRRFGDLRLWSGGADYDSSRPGEPLVLELGFEVENLSDQVLVLDREALTVQAIEPGAPDEVVRPDRSQQPFEALPGSTLRARFTFDLGVERTPSELQAFSVHWTVRAADGTTFREITPFRRDRYAHYYPYDPYWYGYMGWGFTWCW